MVKGEMSENVRILMTFSQRAGQVGKLNKRSKPEVA
jgi:hypothetical protein